jgi:hypothetical protein
MGYRYDFEKMKITSTGGIYVRTFPAAGEIIIDSKISEKPGFLGNSIFTQSLLPKNHSVLIKKDGYYDYLKTLPVLENQVTKLENVLLFKKDIAFTEVADKTQDPFMAKAEEEKFIIKNNNLYYSDTTQNSALTVLEKNTPVIKDLAAFEILNNNIIWLGNDGILYQSDSTGKNPVKLILQPLKLVKKGLYKITADSQNTFVNNNGELLILNTKTNSLDTFASQVEDVKISPDSKNLVYWNQEKIYLYSFSDNPSTDSGQRKSTVIFSGSQITDCLWLNNDYIIFNAVNKIIISEIDYRGNINAITLPQTADKIFFNQQDGKLYVLTGSVLLASEKITP